MVEINSTRLLDDLAALRRIGGQSTGVVREAFTATDLEGRRWLARRFAGTVRLASVRGLWQALEHEHDVKFVPRLPFSGRNHQSGGLALPLLQLEFAGS
jgi:hypothetical protein